MKRGEIYEACLDPTEGSEQSGIRPVIIVSPYNMIYYIYFSNVT
jgi:mRNA-degrading endonuclease toxin of MazEF toxin-antitoxin module